MDRPSYKSWVWKHFSKLDKGAKCNHCNKRYSTRTSYVLKIHLNRAHKIDNNEDYLKWKNNTNDIIWQYFSKQDGYTAQCNVAHCKVLLQHAYNMNILMKHLTNYHEHIIITKQEELACTWLSRHFILTSFYVTCKILSCNYMNNIFCNIHNLIFHLDKCHDIREDSKFEEKTDNNDGTMIQQSVDKTNYAGPSSHHDNTHDNNIHDRQSLGNQEDQQGFNYCGQQGSEPHKIWKPYV